MLWQRHQRVVVSTLDTHIWDEESSASMLCLTMNVAPWLPMDACPLPLDTFTREWLQLGVFVNCQDDDRHWLLASFPPLCNKAFSLSLDTRVGNELDIRGGRRQVGQSLRCAFKNVCKNGRALETRHRRTNTCNCRSRAAKCSDKCVTECFGSQAGMITTSA